MADPTTTVNPREMLSADARRDSILEAYRWMLLSRILEDKFSALYRAGKIVGGVYVGRGQEAFSGAMGMYLDQKRGDIFSGLIRDQAGRLAFGEPLLDSARTFLGSVEGPMRGRDGNVHRGRPRQGLLSMISHLGSMTSVVNGMLMAKRFRGETESVGGTAIGDGGTSTGAFHEALNQAAVEKLPLVVAVADNQFAYSTPTRRQFACEDLVDRATGYGVRGVSIDGTDIEACLDTFRDAVARARGGEGPQMVVGKLLRLSGHGEHDDFNYVPQELFDDPSNQDCVQKTARTILQQEWMTEEEMTELTRETQVRVDEAVARAQSEPKPDPYRDPWHALSTKHLAEGTVGMPFE